MRTFGSFRWSATHCVLTRTFGLAYSAIVSYPSSTNADYKPDRSDQLSRVSTRAYNRRTRRGKVPWTSPYMRIRETPALEGPTLILAFAGWNDAAEVATQAVRFLVRRLDATPIGNVDPEEFFVFTDTRPVVHLDEAQQRKIDWPANDFYYCRGVGAGRDCVLLVGTEPNLRWRTFADTLDRKSVV